MSDPITTDSAGNTSVDTKTILRFEIDKDYTIDLSKLRMTAELASVVNSIFDVFMKRDTEMQKLMRTQAEQEGMYRAAASRLNMVVGALQSEARLLRKERDEARDNTPEAMKQLQTLLTAAQSQLGAARAEIAALKGATP